MPVDDPTARLADLCVELTQHALDPDLGRDARAGLEQGLAGIVADLRRRSPVPRTRFTDDERAAFSRGLGDVNARGTHPLRGRSSPVRANVREHADGSFTTTFDVRHEGIPGRAHGSFVAAWFEVVLGKAGIDTGGAGVNAEMTVRFLVPVPLHETVSFAATTGARSGRTVVVEGTATLADGTLAASATSVFVYPRGATA